MSREPILENRHHIIFPYKSYSTSIEKRVRNLGSLIVKGDASYHKELHIRVEPPPKLKHEQYHDLYQFMVEHCTTIHEIEGLEWGIMWANDRKLYQLEDNLQEQHFYLSGDYIG